MSFVPVRAAASQIILLIRTPPLLAGSAPRPALFLPVFALSSFVAVRALPAIRSETLLSFALPQSPRMSLDRFRVSPQNQSLAVLDMASLHPSQYSSSPLLPLFPLPP